MNYTEWSKKGCFWVKHQQLHNIHPFATKYNKKFSECKKMGLYKLKIRSLFKLIQSKKFAEGNCPESNNGFPKNMINVYFYAFIYSSAEEWLYCIHAKFLSQFVTIVQGALRKLKRQHPVE